jgi:hypothetical protein
MPHDGSEHPVSPGDENFLVNRERVGGPKRASVLGDTQKIYRLGTAPFPLDIPVDARKPMGRQTALAASLLALFPPTARESLPKAP